MLDLSRFQDRIIAEREIPAREAVFGELPADCNPELERALDDVGLGRLYSHQAEFFARALAGENVVITTGTASGKTLAYLLPVLQRILEEPQTRAILLFPTKALAHDQLRGLLEVLDHLGRSEITAGVYDGDTPPLERTRIREKANLILTNPDMLNSGYLPNHGRRGFSHIFRNVRFVVIDELHTYRGAFGSHFANLMRRFRRICAHYGSSPRFLASSATIANPRELAEILCRAPFSLIEEDGSPSSGKQIFFWQPPIVADDFRRSVVQEMGELLPELVNERQRTIAFCRSRKETEVVLKESRDALRSVDGGHDETALLAGYRGGYTPEERRQVERDLVDGRLIGVVSTNALELGIDLGELEVVVQGGFPGTRASFWQQLGRAGRRHRKAVAIVMLRMAPLDQYVGLDPDWLLKNKAEHAVVDPDNLMIQLAHIRAAAAELPLTLDDAAIFPDLGEAVAVLLDAGELRPVHGTFHWAGDAHPAGDFSLRNMDGDRFKIVNRVTGSTLTEMDRPQVYREGHLRAVYLHDGLQYLVEELDLVGHRVVVVPVEQNFYTEPDVRTTIEVLNVQERRDVPRSRTFFGDVRVESSTVGYKMLQFHNHQNLGYEVLPERLTIRLETEGTWVEVPSEVLEVFGGQAVDYLRGMVHAALSCARMQTMAEGSDLSGSSFHFTAEDGGRTTTALVFYDNHPGGLGFAAKAFHELDPVLQGAIRLLERCACRDGCPACTGDYHLERRLVRWGLVSLFEEVAPPDSVRARPRPRPRPEPPRAFAWEDVGPRWSEIVAAIVQRGERGGAFLAGVSATTRGERLVLEVPSPGIAQWLGDEVARKQIKNLVAAAVRVPQAFEVEVRVAADAGERTARAEKALRRRYEDLMGEAS